jgi:hypothetical protein
VTVDLESGAVLQRYVEGPSCSFVATSAASQAKNNYLPLRVEKRVADEATGRGKRKRLKRPKKGQMATAAAAPTTPATVPVPVPSATQPVTQPSEQPPLAAATTAAPVAPPAAKEDAKEALFREALFHVEEGNQQRDDLLPLSSESRLTFGPKATTVVRFGSGDSGIIFFANGDCATFKATDAAFPLDPAAATLIGERKEGAGDGCDGEEDEEDAMLPRTILIDASGNAKQRAPKHRPSHSGQFATGTVFGPTGTMQTTTFGSSLMTTAMGGVPRNRLTAPNRGDALPSRAIVPFVPTGCTFAHPLHSIGCTCSPLPSFLFDDSLEPAAETSVTPSFCPYHNLPSRYSVSVFSHGNDGAVSTHRQTPLLLLKQALRQRRQATEAVLAGAPSAAGVDASGVPRLTTPTNAGDVSASQRSVAGEGGTSP